MTPYTHVPSIFQTQLIYVDTRKTTLDSTPYCDMVHIKYNNAIINYRRSTWHKDSERLYIHIIYTKPISKSLKIIATPSQVHIKIIYPIYVTYIIWHPYTDDTHTYIACNRPPSIVRGGGRRITMCILCTYKTW